MPNPPLLSFDNSFAQQMEGFFVEWQGDKVPNPQVLRLNRGLAKNLGLDADTLTGAVLSGGEAPAGAAVHPGSPGAGGGPASMPGATWTGRPRAWARWAMASSRGRGSTPTRGSAGLRATE